MYFFLPSGHMGSIKWYSKQQLTLLKSVNIFKNNPSNNDRDQAFSGDGWSQITSVLVLWQLWHAVKLSVII